MDKSDFAKRLANKLIEQLKAGTAPWQQPWEAGQMASPYNPTTGNRYRGVNILDVQTGPSASMAGKGRGKGDTDSALDLGGGQAASWKRRETEAR